VRKVDGGRSSTKLLTWLGFFDKMRACDLFVLEDLVLLETKGYANRTKSRAAKVAYG
jgi:hypothetical protein